ncbi:hypothetical protein BU15DRAFT_69272, partial [Melanogaster broomeanus]
MSESVSGSKAFQNAMYIATNLQDILYGVELVLYFKTMQVLFRQGQTGQRTKANIFYACFSSMMFFLITVWVVAQIYRCRVVWNSYCVIAVPSILWVATLGSSLTPWPLGLGIVVDWTSSSPGGNFFEGLPSILGLSYYTISALLNTTVTCIICFHLVRHGTREYAHTYFDVVSIIVESVLPYTLSGIAFLVSFGTGSPTSVAFFFVHIMLMCISPQMLILRVVARRARNDDNSRTQTTTVKFSPGDTSTTSEESTLAVQFQSSVYVPDNEKQCVNIGKVLLT